MASTHPKSLRIGVMLEGVQLSDFVGIDIFGNMSTKILSEIAANGPDYAALLPKAIDMEFFYMAQTMEPFEVTPSLKIVPNVTYDTCPRDLDIVVVGGPFPTFRPAGADRFIKEAWSKTRVWLSTCTGALWLASAGVLSGRKATANRAAVPIARQFHPDVEWLDQRWVIDEKEFDGEGKGEMWTGGGAGAGRLCSLIFFINQDKNEI